MPHVPASPSARQPRLAALLTNTCVARRLKLWNLVKAHLPDHLREYINVEGAMMEARYLLDRQGLGRLVKKLLCSNRVGANGCSERAAKRTLQDKSTLERMDLFLADVKGLDSTFASWSILEFERALLWGCMRFRPLAWSDQLIFVVASEAACYYGGLLALNVFAGGFASLELEAACTASAPRTRCARACRTARH